MSASEQRLAVGDALAEHRFGPISRTTLALFAGASGDHNPMHIDTDFVREAGGQDVFVHGMLSMAILAQVLTRWAGPERLRSYGVRFAAVTPVNAVLLCSARIEERFVVEGETRLRLKVTATVEGGRDVLVGEAVVA